MKETTKSRRPAKRPGTSPLERSAGPAGRPARRPRTNEELSEETRRKLLAAGRALFARRGFADAPAEEIVARAGLTRGALYYQFGDKQGLFVAVLRELLGELARRLAHDTMAGGTAETAELERGCEVLLDLYGEPEVQRLLLLDGPVVLGWVAWRALQEEAGLPALLRHTLDHQVEAGRLEAEAVEPAARLLLGALTQAGVSIAESTDRAAALALYRAQIRKLVRGLVAAPARD